MTDLKQEDDEALISNTIAEICIVLVLLFFLAIGIVISETAPPTLSTPDEKRKATDSGLLFDDSLLQSLRRLKCPFERSENKRRLVLQISSDQDILFEQKSSKPTAYGKACFRPICTYLHQKLTMTDKSNQRISIEGHASSEWVKECRINGTKADKFDCNMELSNNRALSVFVICRGEIRNVSEENLENQRLVETNLEQYFQPRGYSSARPIFQTETDIEDREKSRRVEFSIETRKK